MSTAELLGKQEYKYGFVTDIESDMIPRGLSEDTIRPISTIRRSITRTSFITARPNRNQPSRVWTKLILSC